MRQSKGDGALLPLWQLHFPLQPGVKESHLQSKGSSIPALAFLGHVPFDGSVSVSSSGKWKHSGLRDCHIDGDKVSDLPMASYNSENMLNESPSGY